MIYFLYIYTNKINNKRYIGITCDVKRRHREHIHGRSGARAFYGAIEKYGTDAFDFKVLAIFDHVEAAAYHEQAAILGFGTQVPNGYNLCAGTPGTKYHGPNSEETRRRISESNMGRISGYLGHHPSIETRKKLSDAKRGKRNKNGNISFLGHHHTVEARAKISEAGRRRPPISDETRKKLRARTGRLVSDITRAKLSIRMMGNTNGRLKKEKMMDIAEVHLS
jgi:group I intron endonuclease